MCDKRLEKWAPRPSVRVLASRPRPVTVTLARGGEDDDDDLACRIGPDPPRGEPAQPSGAGPRSATETTACSAPEIGALLGDGNQRLLGDGNRSLLFFQRRL